MYSYVLTWVIFAAACFMSLGSSGHANDLLLLLCSIYIVLVITLPLLTLVSSGCNNVVLLWSPLPFFVKPGMIVNASIVTDYIESLLDDLSIDTSRLDDQIPALLALLERVDENNYMVTESFISALRDLSPSIPSDAFLGLSSGVGHGDTPFKGEPSVISCLTSLEHTRVVNWDGFLPPHSPVEQSPDVISLNPVPGVPTIDPDLLPIIRTKAASAASTAAYDASASCYSFDKTLSQAKKVFTGNCKSQIARIADERFPGNALYEVHGRSTFKSRMGEYVLPM
jgi:hypothetical protein